MPITRNELVGKKVYAMDASSIGEVVDIGFSVGESQATLVARAPDGSLFDLPWDSVGSAKDIVLIKGGIDFAKFRRAVQATVAPEVQTQVQSQPMAEGKKFCTSCGKPLTWIAEYKRWYCYNEKKYV